MNKSNLTNHRFSYFSGTQYVWVKADDGKQLLVIYGDSSGVTEALRDKAKFLAKVESGDIAFDKADCYGFENVDFKERILKLSNK